MKTYPDFFEVKCGYPPKLLIARADQLLTELGIASGDTIIVEKIPKIENVSHSNELKSVKESPNSEPKLVRRIMPDDNSCLFYAIS